MSSDQSNSNNQSGSKKPYSFGGIKDFNLEEIENEVLNDSVYLDVFAGSDARFKEDFMPMQGSLESLKNINTMTYHYKTKEFPEKNFPSERVAGVIASELEKVIPMAVKSDEQGYQYVNYASLAPVLIDALKELNAKVEAQSNEIESLKSKLSKKQN